MPTADEPSGLEGEEPPGEAGRSEARAAPDRSEPPRAAEPGAGRGGRRRGERPAVGIERARERAFRRRLNGLTQFRVIVLTVLVTATALVNLEPTGWGISGLTQGTIYVVALVGYVLSGAYAFALRALRHRGAVVLGYVELMGDVALATPLVLLTGGSGSVFTLFYSLSTVLAAVLLGRVGALFVATVSAGCLFGIAGLEFGWLDVAGWLESLRAWGARGLRVGSGVERSEVVYNLVVNVVAFYTVAMLASYLAEQLERSDVQLEKERLQAAELRALHERIVGSIESGLVTLDLEGRVTFFNRAAEEMLGWSGEEMRGVRLVELLPELAESLAESETTGRADRVTGHDDPSRGRRELRWRMAPLRDAEGGRRGQLLIAEDITEVRRLEEEKKRAEELATLGRLAAAMAHEIRNPLASISGSIEVLRSTAQLDADDARLVTIVSREAEALNAWLTDFLTYARPNLGELVRVDLRELVDEARAMLEHDGSCHSVEVALEGGNEVPVRGDPNYLKQVCWNLLSNAAQAMGGEGRIRVVVERLDEGEHGYGRLRVEDAGRGMSEDEQARIFEPFYTTRVGGTGLGLPTVERIVREHGGRVDVESRKGVGTTFVVDLPRDDGEAWRTDHAS